MKKIRLSISTDRGERSLTIKYSTKGLFYFLLIFITLSYLIWECYWFSKVGLACIKWHSHFLLFLIPLYSIIMYFDWQRKKPNKGVVMILLVLFVLFVSETSLIFSNAIKTPDEKVLGYNVFTKRSNRLKYYHIDAPHYHKAFTREEYNFNRQTNSLGYSDTELLAKTATQNKVRVLCLGDSFTEGDGVRFDESYVSQLRKYHLKAPNYYVFNAGKCGSDPFFNYVNFKDILSQYQFDFVIQTLQSHDLESDFKSRGGLERFKNAYTLNEKEKLTLTDYVKYISFVGRVIINFQNLVKSLFNSDVYIQPTVELFKKYTRLTSKFDAQLILVVFPSKWEVVHGYPKDFFKTITLLKSNPKIKMIDLQPFYFTKYKKNKDTFIKTHWWVEDGHHNSKGYLMMAQGVYSGLKNAKLIKPELK
jgi:hypothetical protein